MELKTSHGVAHLDLDELAWSDSNPPRRVPLSDSNASIKQFIRSNDSWVIEGCYTDLLEFAASTADELIYLDLPVEQCIENARNRKWEPHKYPSYEAQDENLDMLISWIKDYQSRDDVFSRSAHQNLYNNFHGKKKIYTSNARNT
jgi:hypothetical protein